MKILLASDSHGYTERLHELEKIPADLYLFAGDLTDQPTLIPQWRAVAGNNDEYLGIKLPPMATVEAGSHRILLIHGHQFPASQRNRRLAALAKKFGCDIVVFGHSHVPEISEEDGVLLLNPGSVYRSRDGKGTSYMMLDTDKTPPEAQLIRRRF